MNFSFSVTDLLLSWCKAVTLELHMCNGLFVAMFRQGKFYSTLFLSIFHAQLCCEGMDEKKKKRKMTEGEKKKKQSSSSVCCSIVGSNREKIRAYGGTVETFLIIEEVAKPSI